MFWIILLLVLVVLTGLTVVNLLFAVKEGNRAMAYFYGVAAALSAEGIPLLFQLSGLLTA